MKSICQAISLVLMIEIFCLSMTWMKSLLTVMILCCIATICACSPSHSRKDQPMNNRAALKRESRILVLSNFEIVAADQKPAGFYVEGFLEGEIFVPKGQILGSGSFGQSGQPGWVELSNQQFFPEQTGRAPISPYIEGFMTDDNFLPSSRLIN